MKNCLMYNEETFHRRVYQILEFCSKKIRTFFRTWNHKEWQNIIINTLSNKDNVSLFRMKSAHKREKLSYFDMSRRMDKIWKRMKVVKMLVFHRYSTKCRDTVAMSLITLVGQRTVNVENSRCPVTAISCENIRVARSHVDLAFTEVSECKCNALLIHRSCVISCPRAASFFSGQMYTDSNIAGTMHTSCRLRVHCEHSQIQHCGLGADVIEISDEIEISTIFNDLSPNSFKTGEFENFLSL